MNSRSSSDAPDSMPKASQRRVPAPTPIDAFAALNAGLLGFMAAFCYYGRFVEYKGAGNLLEFMVYALALFLVVAGGWLAFRRVQVPGWILLLLQIGILLHFAGGLIPVDGQRLYEWHWAGVHAEWARFDKLVHLYNAFAATLFARTTIPPLSKPGPLAGVLAVLGVMGLGAMVEVLEFFVAAGIPESGVGHYANNMLDLLANFFGACLGALLFAAGRRWLPLQLGSWASTR